MSNDHTEPEERSYSCGCQGRFKCQYHVGNADGYEDGKRDATQLIIEWLLQEPSPDSWPHWKDDTGDVYRDLTAGFIADALARGEHEKGATDE